MRTVQEIKSAIERLSLEERAELVAELCGWTDDEWDRQMKADARAGKFAALNRETKTSDRAVDNSFVWEWIGTHSEYDRRF